MQNSFIIKNADDSFDAYFHQMRKRKYGQGGGQPGLDGTMNTQVAHSATLAGGGGAAPESNFGIVEGIQPDAREGHTTNVSDDGLLFVFGGDRHHMPFNDLHLINLKK